MRSIRVFLVATIVAILILFNFVAALQGYQSSMREADKLFDNQMLVVAKLVANLDVTEEKLTELKLGSDLAFQIWQGDELLAASANTPNTRLREFVPGFDFINFNSYRWRALSQYEEMNDRWVIIAERTDLRFVLAENVVLQSILPLLLGIPIVGILVWILVSRGLAPLTSLSLALKRKPANDLSPLEFSDSRVELEQMLASINGFIARLEAAMDREKRFSADAAHELRTPISALKIQLHNLADSVDPKTPAYRELQDGIDRMQHLIEQLLSLYRSSPEQFEQNSKPVKLFDLVQELVARLYPEFEKKDQMISLEGDAEFEGEELVVNGDAFALETMLTNLMMNASRYTPKGGQIVVSLSRKAGRIRLVVEDDGIGIPEEDRARIFDRFTRLSSAQERGILGCGLGLAIVQHVATLHNTQVEVGPSRFATGSAFSIEFLPWAEREAKDMKDEKDLGA